MHMRFAALLLGGCLAPLGGAHASLLVGASLTSFVPITGASTAIALQGVAAPSCATIAGAGYTVTVTGAQGGQSADSGPAVVNGGVLNEHAIPVAGSVGGSITYLVGDFGSAQTTNSAQSGNYLSTGASPGAITISFAQDQTALGLLWGSIDAGNSLQFYGDNGQPIGRAATDNTVSGSDVQAAASGFTTDGSRMFGGSSYVTVNSTLPFKSVVARSVNPSFEFTAVVGSTQAIAVPDPASLALVACGVLALGMARFRRRG